MQGFNREKVLETVNQLVVPFVVLKAQTGIVGCARLMAGLKF